MLSNPEAKALHDRYGVAGLKNGVFQRGEDGSSCTVGGWYKPPEDPQSIFRKFFGTENPFAAIYDISELKQTFATDCAIVQGEDEVHYIKCSLEEIYTGCEKRVAVPEEKAVSSEEQKVDGDQKAESRVFSIRLRPGVATGTRFIFPGKARITASQEKGSQKQIVKPGCLIFVLGVEKHPRFEREGDDLNYTAKIPLYHALTGSSVQVNTLDNRCLVVPLAGIVNSGSCKIVEGEGMVRCPSGEPGKADQSNGEKTKGEMKPRGDLRIYFDIIFPKFLTTVQRDLLKAAFFLPEQMSSEQVDRANLCNSSENYRVHKRGLIYGHVNWSSGPGRNVWFWIM